MTAEYVDLPVIDLDGFNPKWGASEYAWGPPVDYPASSSLTGQWHEHAFHAEILGWFYHDYLGTHIYAQVWDYRQQDDPNQRWQYMIFLHRPTRYVDAYGAIETSTWAWALRHEFESGDDIPPPFYAEVGRIVDQWVTSPDILRIIIQGDTKP